MEIRKQIHRFICESLLFTNEFAYSDDASLLQHGILDSVGFLEMVSFVEGAFGISIAPAEMTPDHLDSVNKLVSFISSKLQTPGVS